MARFSFSTFANGDTMSSVRTTINNNFNAAMAKPLNGTTPLDAGTNAVYLVAINTSGITYTMASSRFVATGGSASLTNLSLSGNLAVNGNTILGDSTADTIRLNGTVVGNIAAPSANETINVLTANAVNASVGNFTTLNVGGSAYKPWIASSTAPTDTTRFWVNTAASVPYLQYHNGTSWVSLGAVFG